MNIEQAAKRYLQESPGFSLGTGAPSPEQGAASMRSLVKLAAESDAPEKFRRLDQIVAATAELAPDSAALFNQFIIDDPKQRETAKALEIAMEAMLQRSPETWKHILHQTALTMLYYEKQTAGEPQNLQETLTLMVGAIGHDVGKVGLDPNLLHKSTRVAPERFTAALENYKNSVPEYPEKLHDTIFLEEANKGKILFADPGAAGAPVKDALILDIGKDMRRSEEYWVKDDERQRHNAIWQRINTHAQASVKDGWLTDVEQKALTMPRRGTVTPEEMKVIETHDAMSEAFFAAAPMPTELSGVKGIVSMDRFRKEEQQRGQTPVLAEIIHTTDVFEAITGARSYRKPYSVEEAITVMDGMAKQGKVDRVILDDMKKSGAITTYADAAGLQHSSDLKPLQSWVQKVRGNIASVVPNWAHLPRRDNNAGVAAVPNL